jgi:general nucleoside transport system permease protein
MSEKQEKAGLFTRIFSNKKTSYIFSLVLSVVLAFIICAFILLIAGYDPIKAYGAMVTGAFDSLRHIGDVLEYAMVLCICGLACVLGARVGIFNVGGEGQLLLGAIFAAQVGIWLDGSSKWIVIPLAAIAAMLAGAVYAFIPGWLKVKQKVDEVITTIMMNTIAAYLCNYLAKGPWKSSNKNLVAATQKLNADYWFTDLIPRSNLTTAIIAAAIIALAVWYVMERTAAGYDMRITGSNPRFAFFSGLKTDKIVILGMVVSGMMCGLVGMFRVYGVEHLYRSSISNDYYFEGLMVAMISQYNPVNTIWLSLFFAVLKIGAQGMELIGVPSQIYLILQTVIIFFMAAESGITASIESAVRARKAKAAAQARLKGGEING